MTPGMLRFDDNPPEVLTPLGKGLLMIVIDYGVMTNPIYHVRMHEDGKMLNFDSVDCRWEGNEIWGLKDTQEVEHKVEKAVCLGCGLEKPDVSLRIMPYLLMKIYLCASCSAALNK